jgi:hypothetical protein
MGGKIVKKRDVKTSSLPACHLGPYLCFGTLVTETVKREFKINQQNETGNILVNRAGI